MRPATMASTSSHRQVTALDLANAQLIEALYELTSAIEQRGDVGGAKRKVMLWELERSRITA